MPAVIPDRPLSGADEDELARAPFAESVADLILGAPIQSSLRIGIYGGWGEGKTSVLKLVERKLRDEGHYAVWLAPWAASTREELLADLFMKVAAEVGLNPKKLRAAKRFAGITQRFRETSKSDLRVGLADALVGTWVEDYVSRSVETTTASFLTDVEKALEGKKLTVFVDDVDRLRPDLVPQVLLTLREALDHPNFFYVMALAPEIVEVGLSQVHQGWGTPKQFLEKIIELPLVLPPPTEGEWNLFIERQAKKLPPSPLWQHKLGQYLPTNPRKAKLFFRFAGSLQRLLARFQEQEVDWQSLALCLMLTLEFPTESRRLANDDKAISDLLYGAVTDQRDSGSKKTAEPKAYAKHAPTADPERFLELCEALRERKTFTRGAYSLRQMLTIHESPPVLTWLELDSLHESARDDGIAAISAWLEASPVALRTPRAAAFFSMIREWRNGLLDRAAEAELQVDLKERLVEAREALALLHDYIRAGLPFGADEWLQVYGQAAHWAHFNRLGYYSDTRATERAFLDQSIDYLNIDSQIEILTRSNLRHESVVSRRPDEFLAFSDSLRGRLQATVASAALGVFEQDNGVEQFWGEKGNSLLKAVVFDPGSIFHTSSASRRKFQGLAKRALDGDRVVEANFRAYFRMLTYAAFEHGGSFPVRDAQKLLSNAEFVALVWRASVVTPLNPRTMGSLRDDRDNVIKAGIADKYLPLPPWWVELETELNAASSELSDDDEDGEDDEDDEHDEHDGSD